jgi:hypothetical protein
VNVTVFPWFVAVEVESDVAEVVGGVSTATTLVANTSIPIPIIVISLFMVIPF